MKIRIVLLALIMLMIGTSCNNTQTELRSKADAVRKVFPGGKVFVFGPQSGAMLYVVDSLGNLYEITNNDPINTQLTNIRKGIEIQ